MNKRELQKHRRNKDKFFKEDNDSPLTPQQRETFEGLTYFEPEQKLDFKVEVERFAEDDMIELDTTTGMTLEYRRYGQFTITVERKKVRLTLYEAPYGFFLPFVDAGAGTETYPAGRYLEPTQIDENTFRVDFNYAYNPYCAYNDSWTCPLTPPENHITVAIRAGEKLPESAWVPQAK